VSAAFHRNIPLKIGAFKPNFSSRGKTRLFQGNGFAPDRFQIALRLLESKAGRRAGAKILSDFQRQRR